MVQPWYSRATPQPGRQRHNVDVLIEDDMHGYVCSGPTDMAAIADFAPFTDEEITGFLGTGLAWVASDDDIPVGYLLAEIVDGCLYISQVSVHPRVARQGLGQQLIDHVAAEEYPALVLTTFRDVPWNAPYYQRLGFVILADDEITPGLRTIREYQATIGLDRWPRVCMRRNRATP
jgi:ribosomal protein S18 acetylase RimI-like enzyme